MLKKTVTISDLYTDQYIGHLTLLQNWTELPLQIILFHSPQPFPQPTKKGERQETCEMDRVL